MYKETKKKKKKKKTYIYIYIISRPSTFPNNIRQSFIEKRQIERCEEKAIICIYQPQTGGPFKSL